MSFARDLLAHSLRSPAPAHARPAVTSTEFEIQKLIRFGLIAGVFLFALLLAWAALATISGAVVAPGVVVVDSSVKKIQHPTGGVVGEIRVREGESVPLGAVLLRLDETTTKANLQIILAQLYAQLGRQARLSAERDGRGEIVFPPELIAIAAGNEDSARVMQGEAALFRARRDALEGQKAQLGERASQLALEAQGLEAQLAAKGKEIELIQSELQGVEDLYKRNLVPITRVMPLRREVTRLMGEHGALVSQIASTKGKISETKLQILNLDQDRRSEVSRDLRESEAKIVELTERRIAAEDQLRRVDIRAPTAGIVHQLAVHTVGGVIQPGEALMSIVPQNETLTVETRVSPLDVEQVKKGTSALVRLTGFNTRTTPDLTGQVVTVSADASHDDKAGVSFFVARIELPEAEVKKLGDRRLIPGMPAEVFIETGQRTMLSYLVKPLSEQLARAFRER